MKTFRYRLYPSASQHRLLERTVETYRRFYNDCLAERKEAWESGKRKVGKVEQMSRVKTVKATNPYAADVHNHVLQVTAADLDRAFRAVFRHLGAGVKPGYPRFKGRNRFDSFGLKEYKNGWKIDGRRLRLHGIGRVAVRRHRALTGEPKTLRSSASSNAGWLGGRRAARPAARPSAPLPSGTSASPTGARTSSRAKRQRLVAGSS